MGVVRGGYYCRCAGVRQRCVEHEWRAREQGRSEGRGREVKECEDLKDIRTGSMCGVEPPNTQHQADSVWDELGGTD
ncbi:hypothetical protein E2C01_024227 [Portunus trituberculatus]|uniref:Uncharacterized protein n=1 Tax=Portunus trituberculatus TaxID=210409 RepID=A0A5B7EC58_PORTR|nr:hypothetical protein [Portunus trituberculatus]